ncbi:hypothetical protein [Nonomuraea typhae]|uniref:hypothetical protein n=1 Tax=Nonomuraea typhae TaxID=2603600 RepID=UPI0012FB5626|nr:hypothetical protein [Nonomuraea typhae]
MLAFEPFPASHPNHPYAITPVVVPSETPVDLYQWWRIEDVRPNKIDQGGKEYFRLQLLCTAGDHESIYAECDVDSWLVVRDYESMPQGDECTPEEVRVVAVLPETEILPGVVARQAERGEHTELTLRLPDTPVRVLPHGSIIRPPDPAE